MNTDHWTLNHKHSILNTEHGTLNSNYWSFKTKHFEHCTQIRTHINLFHVKYTVSTWQSEFRHIWLFKGQFTARGSKHISWTYLTSNSRYGIDSSHRSYNSHICESSYCSEISDSCDIRDISYSSDSSEISGRRHICDSI